MEVRFAAAAGRVAPFRFCTCLEYLAICAPRTLRLACETVEAIGIPKEGRRSGAAWASAREGGARGKLKREVGTVTAAIAKRQVLYGRCMYDEERGWKVTEGPR